MRVLVLCYEYPPIGGGGGRVAKSIAQELAARGHEVRVQTAALGWRSTVEHDGKAEVLRTATGRRSPDTCRVHEMAAYLVMSVLPVLRICREWKPDVIHAHFAMPTGVLAWLAHRVTGVPYVLTAHLGDVPGGVPEQTDALFRWFGPMARAVWKSAAGLTAVSQFVQELAERAYSRPVRRILNGVDLANRPPRPEKLSGDVAHLVFLGRLNPQKNAPLLIEAMNWISLDQWRLTVIGDGPDRGEVELEINIWDFGKEVHLTGWQSAFEVAAILETADILCMPSSSEGMPVAAIEGLRHGLAIAGTDIPGLRDVLEPGHNGLTAPVGNAKDFGFILIRMLLNRDELLAMRQASWDKAAEFNLQEIATAYEQVLRDAASSLQMPD